MRRLLIPILLPAQMLLKGCSEDGIWVSGINRNVNGILGKSGIFPLANLQWLQFLGYFWPEWTSKLKET